MKPRKLSSTQLSPDATQLIQVAKKPKLIPGATDPDELIVRLKPALKIPFDAWQSGLGAKVAAGIERSQCYRHCSLDDAPEPNARADLEAMMTLFRGE